MPDDLLDTVEAALARATPGPWAVHPNPRFWVLLPHQDGDENRNNDAACVVTLHNAAPELIERVRRAEAEREAARGEQSEIFKSLEAARNAVRQIEADRDQWKARAEMFIAEAERLRNDGNNNAIAALKTRRELEAAEGAKAVLVDKLQAAEKAAIEWKARAEAHQRVTPDLVAQVEEDTALAHRDGAAEERAAIVAWLQAKHDAGIVSASSYLARCIADGAHRGKEE